jgi:hypothetical protein
MKRTIGLRSKAVLFTCLSPLLLASPALPEPQAKAAKHTEQAIAALTRNTDGDSLAAAGLLSLDKHPGQSLPLVARAIAAAPERADLAWLQAQVCQKLPPCDPEPMETRLRELDPSNGASWLRALDEASAAKNDADIDTALARIGQSDRVDIYWTSLIAHLSRAAAATGKLSLEDAEVSIVGYLAAEALPGYAAASLACKGERLQHAEAVASCRGLANAFQHGDNLVTEMVGVSIAERVWPPDSPEWKSTAEARRVYEYRAKFTEKLDLRGEKRAKEYLTLCAQHRREQDVFVAQMIAAGVNPDPPAE